MTRLPLSARCSCLLLAVLLLVCSPALANPSSLVAATASRPRTENAYVFVYSHDAKDAQAKLLGTRVTIRSLQVTRPKYEIVVLVSPSTPEGVRQIFQGYGARVVDAIDRFNSSAASAPLSTGSTTWYPVTRAAAKEPVDALTFYTARKTFRESYYATKCPYNRDFLYVYTLTEYRRVLYIEAEALVYRNLDEMFNCGHFCLTYANENCWNSGIMVIKPDMNEFNRFVSHFMDKNAAFEKDAHNRILFKPKIPCFEEYHDSLLIMYPSIEAAPLFYANKGPQEAPVMRVNLLYSVNAIFFYEHFHWTLYRLNLPLDVHGKSYDPAKYRLVDETTLSQALDTSKDDGIQWGIPNDVPAFVMSFYHPQPWYWWEAAYFDLNWYWQDMRYLLLPDTPTVVMNTVFSRLSMLLVLYLVVEYLMNANFTPEFREKMLVYWGGSSFGFSQTTDTADKMRQIFINDNDSTPVKPGHQSGLSQVVTILVHLFRVPISVRFKGIVAGILLGVFAIVSTTVILVIPVIPNTTPPSWAWPIFCLYQNFWIYVFLRTVMNVFPNPESLVPYIDVRLSSFAGAIILEAVTLAHNKANLHKHFVEKILAFAIFLALIWLLQTRHFRKYMVNRFEAQEAQAKGSVKQEKV